MAFAESSFFPVPPDVMLVPMAVSRPDRVWFYAAIATVASVLGGLVGYAIGALLFDSLGDVADPPLRPAGQGRDVSGTPMPSTAIG